jgi:hypothetical protein
MTEELRGSRMDREDLEVLREQVKLILLGLLSQAIVFPVFD